MAAAEAAVSAVSGPHAQGQFVSPAAAALLRMFLLSNIVAAAFLFAGSRGLVSQPGALQAILCAVAIALSIALAAWSLMRVPVAVMLTRSHIVRYSPFGKRAFPLTGANAVKVVYGRRWPRRLILRNEGQHITLYQGGLEDRQLQAIADYVATAAAGGAADVPTAGQPGIEAHMSRAILYVMLTIVLLANVLFFGALPPRIGQPAGFAQNFAFAQRAM